MEREELNEKGVEIVAGLYRYPAYTYLSGLSLGMAMGIVLMIGAIGGEQPDHGLLLHAVSMFGVSLFTFYLARRNFDSDVMELLQRYTEEDRE